MTQEDIIRRIIEQDGCQGISCDGKRLACYNTDVECPFFAVCTGRENSTLYAKAWMNERGLLPYSSTFTVAHRFKPGDRVQRKCADGLHPAIITVADVMFGADCGAFYRFADGITASCSVSYCDENLRLADCNDEAGQAGEVKYYTRDCRGCEKGTGYSDVCFTCQTTATGWETD